MSRWNLEGLKCQDIAEDIGARCFNEENRELLEFTEGTQEITIEDLFIHYYGDCLLTYSKELTFKAIAIKNKEHEYLFDQLRTLIKYKEDLMNPDNYKEMTTTDLSNTDTNTAYDTSNTKDTAEDKTKSDQLTRASSINRTLTGERSKQVAGLEDIDDLRRIGIGAEDKEQAAIQLSNLDYNKHAFDRTSSGALVGTTSNSTTSSTSFNESKRDSAHCSNSAQLQVKSTRAKETLESIRVRIPELRIKIMNLYYDFFRGVPFC